MPRVLTVRHPARDLPFERLVRGLDDAVRKRAVYTADDGDLRLYHYTDGCVYDGLWNPFSLLARGLVVDRRRKEVVATPFPKFFNLGERGVELPDGPFEAYDKLDGSLGIVFFHEGRWRAITKGAFGTPQAGWAEERLAACGPAVDGALQPGGTYLFEIVHRANRIVVRYPFDDLVLIGGYDPDGHELSYEALCEVGDRVGTRVTRRHPFRVIEEVVEAAGTLGREAEGFVLRFAGGERLKVKGEAYRRAHRLITRVTPLGVWEALVAGEPLDDLRREIPEEYWDDFDRISAALEAQVQQIVEATQVLAEAWADRSDKELGLARQRGELPEPAGSLVFACRKSRGTFPDRATRQVLLRRVRPVGNRLPGYTPSTGLVGFLAAATE